MKTSKQNGLILPAVVGATVGFGSTAIRALEANYGPLIGYTAGAAVCAVFAYVVATVDQYVLNRKSQSAE